MFGTKPANMSYASCKSETGKYTSATPAHDQTAHEGVLPRKYNHKGNPYVGAQAASIARRNARERNRVKQVNDGFNALRKRLPGAVINALSGGARRGTGKKLSKVDTLRMVVEYIRYLENLIESEALETDANEADEGVIGRTSPYSECVASPVNSECSSGVSSAYSLANELQSIPYANEYVMNETQLLSEMWWHLK